MTEMLNDEVLRQARLVSYGDLRGSFLPYLVFGRYGDRLDLIGEAPSPTRAFGSNWREGAKIQPDEIVVVDAEGKVYREDDRCPTCGSKLHG